MANLFVQTPAPALARGLGRLVLTPHTSNGQVREMEKGKMPIRMISIGRTYRRQSDVSHSPMFHQFEGLMIDKHVTIAELKGTFDYLVKRFFGSERKVRLRPYNFPFTEPSFEIDISCSQCLGAGRIGSAVCRLCKEGWHELGGAGMVHPNVLRAGGIDPTKWQGYAFGGAVDRLAMPRYGIDDIRLFWSGNLNFLR